MLAHGSHRLLGLCFLLSAHSGAFRLQGSGSGQRNLHLHTLAILAQPRDLRASPRGVLNLRGGGFFSPARPSVQEQQAQKEAEEAAAAAAKREEELERGLECNTCLNLLYQPITLLCGHAFCGLCIKSWLRSLPVGSRICPLCRAPAEHALGELRTSYALAATIRTLFPKLYAARQQETADALYFPAKDAPLTDILVRSETLYPGTKGLVAAAEDEPTFGVLSAAYENQTRLLYFGNGREAGTQGSGADSPPRVRDVAVELEVTSVRTVSSLDNATSHLVASVLAHDRVLLTDVQQSAGPGVGGRGGAVRTCGRGLRFYDDVEDERAVVQELSRNILKQLPYFLANVMLFQDPPRDPEALSVFVGFVMGTLLEFPVALHQRFLYLRSTRQRLEELQVGFTACFTTVATGAGERATLNPQPATLNQQCVCGSYTHTHIHTHTHTHTHTPLDVHM